VAAKLAGRRAEIQKHWSMLDHFYQPLDYIITPNHLLTHTFSPHHFHLQPNQSFWGYWSTSVLDLSISLSFSTY